MEPKEEKIGLGHSPKKQQRLSNAEKQVSGVCVICSKKDHGNLVTSTSKGQEPLQSCLCRTDDGIFNELKMAGVLDESVSCRYCIIENASRVTQAKKIWPINNSHRIKERQVAHFPTLHSQV